MTAFHRHLIAVLLRFCQAALLLMVGGCGQTSQVVDSSASSQEDQKSSIPVPPGDLMNDHISFEFAIYFLPMPAKDALNELDSLLMARFPDIERVEVVEPSPSKRMLAAKLETDLQTAYPLPDRESLRYAGHGLTDEQAEALQESKQALVLWFGHPKDHVWDGLKSSTELVHTLAQSTGGLIWDDETREVFSPEAWEQRRITEWTDAIPDVSTETVIHAYPKGELIRAITLGMSKFGLPDLVVDQCPRSNQRNIGHLLNLMAQALAEGAVIIRPGEFDLDFKSIKHPGVREPQTENLKENATGVALLSLREGRWEEGDPCNRLIEITFERGEGPDIHAQQEFILSQAFGSEDSVARIKHDDELQQVSRRAREKLSGLRSAFQMGLASGEYLLVKAPFKTPDGNTEWMWVEVTSWQGDKISGLLQNDPFDIPDLKAGQAVNVSEAEVFDYIHTFPDGSMEGNETAQVIEKQSR